MSLIIILGYLNFCIFRLITYVLQHLLFATINNECFSMPTLCTAKVHGDQSRELRDCVPKCKKAAAPNFFYLGGGSAPNFGSYIA